MYKMKPSRPVRYPLQDYRNRAYTLWLLDERVFDAMNKGVEGNFAAYSGCLDALDFLPAGSMVSIGGNFYDASTIERGVSAEEQKRINDFMNSL